MGIHYIIFDSLKKSGLKITFFQKKQKNPLTKWGKNDENRIRNMEVMTYWKYPFFLANISRPALMNIQYGEMMISWPHNFVHVSITEKKNLIFRDDNVNLTFYPPKINEELYFLWHISIQGYTFTCIWQKKWYFSQFHVWWVW